MTDEPRPEGSPETSATESPAAEHPTPESPAPAPEAGSAPAATLSAPPDPAEAGEGAKTNGREAGKLQQTVEIRDVGPCKKHIKVTVERQAIDARLGEKFKELMTDSTVAGFRPGKAPRKIVERRFHREVNQQVKTEVLMASLEQLAEEHQIAPLSTPELDPDTIQLPGQGPLVYEFEVEVRPEFDLPNYRGLKLRRPVHTFTDHEVAEEERRVLAPHGQVVPKPEGNAQVGDILVADITSRDGDRVLGSVKEASVTVNRQLAFKDGLAEHFAEQVRGSNPGDTRVVDVTMSSAAADPNLRGKNVQSTFAVKDVKTVRLPELTHEFLHRFGVHSPEQFRELIRVLLQRRLEHQQRQWARRQVLEQISAASSWELPRDLLARQAHKALARRVMEMKSDGISDQEIAARQRLLQQDILQSTALALKEHFVLQKIAEVEKIDISDDDLNDEIERIAAQENQSPRRVRARLEKEELLETLATEMIERKALDLVLDSAEYEDVPLGEEEPAVSTVEAQAIPGAMQDPSTIPPEQPPEAAAEPTPAAGAARFSSEERAAPAGGAGSSSVERAPPAGEAGSSSVERAPPAGPEAPPPSPS
jgi:trigger factor